MTENLKINVFDNLENYTEQEIVNGYPLPENVGLIKVAAIGLAQTPVKDILAAEEIPDTGGYTSDMTVILFAVIVLSISILFFAKIRKS